MKIRNIFAAVAATAMLPCTLMLSGATAGEAFLAAADITRRTAYISAGFDITQSMEAAETTEVIEVDKFSAAEEDRLFASTTESAEINETFETAEEVSQPFAQVITQNVTFFDDGLDYTAEGENSGATVRRTYSYSDSVGYITLASGAQVRNCTHVTDDELLSAAEELPELDIELYSAEPQVLIVHTHTTESFEPYSRSYFDADFPSRTRDPRHNMIAVGEVLAQTLADNGISVLHDGTLHDHPSYTGSYDRSEATIRAALEQYPSIKIVIDLHRDAIAEPDGTRIAPVAEIDGRNAAQFMIIAGCDDGRFNMPHYMENYKLAALIQNFSGAMYPELARAVLFDYRNYNQHITTGSLLIEVGSHANSLDEALYCAELLGESMARALTVLAE